MLNVEGAADRRRRTGLRGLQVTKELGRLILRVGHFHQRRVVEFRSGTGRTLDAQLREGSERRRFRRVGFGLELDSVLRRAMRLHLSRIAVVVPGNIPKESRSAWFRQHPNNFVVRANRNGAVVSR